MFDVFITYKSSDGVERTLKEHRCSMLSQSRAIAIAKELYSEYRMLWDVDRLRVDFKVEGNSIYTIDLSEDEHIKVRKELVNSVCKQEEDVYIHLSRKTLDMVNPTKMVTEDFKDVATALLWDVIEKGANKEVHRNGLN